MLYDLTQGVTDFLIKLLVLAQRHAIHTGEERLTLKLLRTIADTRMQLLKPALDALRSGDTKRMSKFEDLLPPDSQIAAMMGAIDGDARVSSRLAMLQDMRRPPAGNAEASLSPIAVTSGIPSTGVKQSGVPVPSEARRLVECDAPFVALRDAGWLQADALEFSTAYADC
ncbi:hypothetical protein [Burkholderia vietnamiensis]|uniref:hypothetical protein n=1 Tax=Burkholderia vietnamiensis TaxID=60552 RepID=UPI001CF31C5A|nr:hypothetical protein [Burkholderia vietnamiensis]MCA8291413.1 hypothetical protein [Burkholderia vietnamiensis]